MNDLSPKLQAFPATPLQLGMLYHGMVAPDSAIFLQHYSMLVSGPFDADLFAASWDYVVNRHAALRSSFHWQGLDQCLQVVHDKVTLPVIRHDWRDIAESDHDARLRELVDADRHVPFNLENPPLARMVLVQLAEDKHFVIVAFHHVVADGWSLNVAMDEVAAHYAAVSQGQSVDLPEAPSFKAYATWLRKVDPSDARSFWKERLEDAVPCRLPLRRAFEKNSENPDDLCYRNLHLGQENTAILLQAARDMGVTSATLMQAAWALVLARYEQQDRVLFAISSANRPAAVPGINRIFGPLMAILPCHLEIDNEIRVRDWLQQIQSEQLQAREYDFLSPAEHQKIAGFSALDEFLNSMLVVEDMPASRTSVWDDMGIGFTMYDAYDRTAYALNMFVFPGEDYLLRMGFDRRQFSNEAVDQVLYQMKHLCLTLAGRPDDKLGSVTLSSGKGEDACLQGESISADIAPLWPRLSAVLPGLDVALQDVSGGRLASGSDLLARAGRLDGALTAAGVAPGDWVALMLQPGLDYAASILACLRRGSPYALLDPMLPSAAIVERLQATGIRALVAPASILAGLGMETAIVSLDPAAVPQDVAVPDPRPETDLTKPILMVWTSGSTGTPKAPVLTQGAVVNRLLWDEETFARETDPAILLKTSPAFVDAVAEVLQPLFSGFPAIVPDPDEARSPSGLLQAMKAAKPSRLVLTPSMAQAMVEAEERDGLADPWPLHRLHLSGEPLAQDLIDKLSARLSVDAVILNIYGSAEVTADVTVERIDPATVRDRRIAIGTPLPGCDVWLLDANRRPVAPGAVGEMYMAGICLAQCYHNAPALTGRSFIDWTGPDGQARRLYATGDLAKLSADGRLIPLGRKDAQIKIRGVRIEPAEIEARLLELSDIRAAVVSAVKPADGQGDPRLVAYLEPAAAAADEADREDHWRLVYEQSYQDLADSDVMDDFRIWQGAITGAPIPPDHMRAWVHNNLDIVRDYAPQSVVEVGCGQGLLLGHLAPDCRHYLGTDISQQALDCISRLREAKPELSHVETALLAADRALPEGLIPDGGFDLALLSSVVQYFPGEDYLLRSLGNLLPAMAEGGRVLLADLRSLPLNPLLATEILFNRADDGLDRNALLRRLHQIQAQEAELLVDPRYFLSLKSVLPRLAAVEARPKPGSLDNELSSYRYEVILHLDHVPDGAVTTAEGTVPWQGLSALRDRLTRQDGAFTLTGLPHRRLQPPLAAQRLLQEEAVTDAQSWRQAVEGADLEEGLDPGQVTALAGEAGYQAAVTLSLTGDSTSFDIRFTPKAQSQEQGGLLVALPGDNQKPRADRISTPYHAAAEGDVIDRAKAHLTNTLPQSFIPQHFITINQWPKSPSNKIIKNKLPKPDLDEKDRPVAAPEGTTEVQLADLWKRILRRDVVSRDDDFLAIGGNSLLMTQLAFSIGKAFGVKFPLRAAFATPVLKDMALRIETIIQGEVETGSTQGDQRVAEDARLADMLVPPAGQQVPLWPAGRATVFHSGEGGMLSHWILRHILQDPDIDVIYLGSGRTVEESQRIIADDWTRLGFGRLDLLEKIDILPGSLAQQRFGLSQEAWDDLAETADVLFHAGIHINMAARYAQLRPANVLGTREMMRLSLHKKLKPLHAIGSYAVIDHSTVSQHGDAFFEDSPFPSYAGLEGDYRKTRWASESMMQAAIARGMPIALHRIPLMCGDSRTGLTDPGEIAWRLCKAMIVTGGVPESKRPLDIAPIDHAVDALFTLVKDGSAAPGINHIIGARSLVWADMADALRHMGYQVADMAPAEWYARLSQWIETNPEDDSLGGLMPLVNADAADHSKFYHVDGGATRDRLAALGFTLSPTQRDDLVRTLDYLVQADILPALEKCKVGAA